MNPKKHCVGCGCRLTADSRRRVTDKCVRLFVATRLFPSIHPNDGFICSKCRWMYNKWKDLPEVRNILTMVDNGHQATDTISDDISGLAESDSECMDDENRSDQSVNEMGSNNELTDDDSADEETMNEMNADRNSKADDMMTTNGEVDDGSIEIPIDVSFSSKRQCCVCKEQMVPPTRTIREDDRNEMFIRRHIDIPAGSRCCESHTVDNYLKPDAFLSLTP